MSTKYEADTYPVELKLAELSEQLEAAEKVQGSFKSEHWEVINRAKIEGLRAQMTHLEAWVEEVKESG